MDREAVTAASRPATIGWREIEVDGARRRYLLVEPSDPPSAIVLSLHGSRSTAGQQRGLSGMDRLAALGAVVVYPEGAQSQGFGRRWDPDRDVPFIGRLVESLLAAHPVPRANVVAAGMSGGARLACRLASLRPDLIGTVGAVAGLRAPPRGTIAKPVRVIAFHGTADRVNPYAGHGRAEWRESVEEAAAAWAAANGVATTPEVEASGRLRRTTYGPGTPGEVRLWTIAGAGHTWPGGRLGLIGRLFLGGTSRDIDATEAIWRFAGGVGD